MKQTISLFKCTVLILVLFATPAVGSARTLTYTGNADFPNRWSESNNWSPSGPPVNGDTLVFPAGFTPVNDLTNLEVHSIQFTGNGSTYLSGNPVTVESDITAANNNGEARVSFDITFSSGGGTFYTLGSSFLNIEDNVYLGNNLALNLYAISTNIWVQGSIQGAADLVKLGPDDAYLYGGLVNSYSGGTYVRGGTLHLAKSANITAVSSKLVVGMNTTVFGSIVDDTVGQYPPVMDVTVGPYGQWFLNGTTTVTNLSLINSNSLGTLGYGGWIQGSGIINLSCDVNVTGVNTSQIFPTLYLGSQTRTFYVDETDGYGRTYFSVHSIVGTGAAGIVKAGPGEMILESPNDYAGPTLVNEGLLGIDDPLALGASTGTNAGTIVSSGAGLQFDSVTTAEPLTFNEGSFISFSGSNALNGAILLNGACALQAVNLGLQQILQFNNVISGAGSLGIDAGTVRLAGTIRNFFTGGVEVGGDGYVDYDYPAALELAKPNNVLAVPGLLEVERATLTGVSPAVVRNFQDNGVTDVRLGHIGQWLLNGHVASPRSLLINGDALIDSQGGQLQMTNYPGTNQIYIAARPELGNYTAQIAGTLAMLSPTDEFYIESGPTLQLSALVTGPGSLLKTGPGSLMIAGTDFNDYAGETFVNQGTLLLNKPYAATAIPGAVEVGTADGSSAGTLRNLNSYQIVGAINVHSQGLYDVNGQEENTDYLNLDGNATVETGVGYLSLKTGAGITVTPGVNTSATINDNLVLDPGNHVITVGSGSSIPGVQDLVINAAIGETSPTASIQKEGPGLLRLSGSSSYTGTTYVNHGKIFATAPSALGATNGYTYVSNDASLVLDGGVTIPGEMLYLNSTAPAALESWSGSNIWAGAINLVADSQIAVTNYLSAYGIIGGSGNLSKAGAGTLMLDGDGANTYSGDTFVNEGTLVMKKSQLDVPSIPHNVTVGTGPGGPPTTLFNLNEGTIGGRVTVNDGGTWNLNNWGQIFQNTTSLGGPALTMNGNAAVQSGTVGFFNDGSFVINAGNNTTATISSQVSFFYANTLHVTVSSGGNQPGKPECVISGAISQFIPPSNLLKDGAGTLRLTATNTYTGTNFVNNGTLWIDGVQPQGPVQLSGATLGGYGIAGNIALNGSSAVISPGEGPGILTCSNFTSTSGTFLAELDGTTPGNGYDQLNVRGTVSLNGLALNASLNYASSVGDQFTIINNDGTDPVLGTFTGLPQGKKLYVGEQLFQISYTGGSGNDVVLSRLATPPPPTLRIQSVPPVSIRLLWATNDPPFSLQTTTNLLAKSWIAALPSPVVVGTNNIVTNAVAGVTGFYRLSGL